MIANLVSIIMPSYNASRFIVQSIESVIAQTYTSWELLIVDDHSKDDTVSVVSPYVNDQIKLFALDKNVGAAQARNIAIEHAQGQYIAFLDSDDLWYPEKLQLQIEYMRIHHYAFTFSGYDLMSESGCLLNKHVHVPKSITYHHYLRDTIIGCLTVMIDQEQVGKVYMPNIKSSHDMALWLKILKQGYTGYGFQKELATYRIVSTSNTSRKWKAAKDVWKVYRDIEHLSFLYASFCFVGYALHAILKRL